MHGQGEWPPRCAECGAFMPWPNNRLIDRTKMECIRCHGFSSTRVCWSCSQRVDAIDFAMNTSLRAQLATSEALLQEAHRFLNAQAYEREEMDDFCRRLDTHLGIESDKCS